jgi:hypothetical protein
MRPSRVSRYVKIDIAYGTAAAVIGGVACRSRASSQPRSVCYVATPRRNSRLIFHRRDVHYACRGAARQIPPPQQCDAAWRRYIIAIFARQMSVCHCPPFIIVASPQRFFAAAMPFSF